jgi:formate-dependent nitrite reductase membrane component NrfD/ferredoxin
MYQRPDGIVDFDKSICIGCKACIAACPFDAIFINPEDHSAEKCNFCAHRLEIGLEPACVVVCPTEAILISKIDDHDSRASKIVNRSPVSVRNGEKATRPKLYYKGAHQATLDPIAARRPSGDTYMWSEIPKGHGIIPSGHPEKFHGSNSSANAKLVYDVGHTSPWGWEVSLYTWTKGLASGAYVVPIVLALMGKLSFDSPLVRYIGPIVALFFLAVTGVLLIADLKHPERFYLLFTKGKWNSWLVKGGYIIMIYGAILAVDLIAGIVNSPGAEKLLAIPGIPFGVMTAAYTAFLFGQAKARDLWQNPLLPFHLPVQALLVGISLVTIGALHYDPSHVDFLARVTSALAVLNLLLVIGESAMRHPTAKAHLAANEMIKGKYAGAFWLGIVLNAIAIFTPLVGGILAIASLLCILPFEHAYVQAGQEVPLA